MKAIGKIGVIIPAVVDSLESELLNEIYNIACKSGYDIIVFTNSSNSLDSFAENEYVYGEKKIYELLSSVELDGILFAGGRFHSARVISYITEIIKKCGIPCIMLEMEQNDFPYVYPSQREDIFAVTEHLITIHGYEKIYCLTGPENSYEAEERLIGFKTAMQHYGLDENNYFYGDFWKNSAVILADDIINGKIEMPEAVVCTNDSMAISLCNELKAKGIKIPEQIAVTGYDGNFEALSYEPSITTVVHKQKELAFRAFEKLSEIMNINFNQQMNDRKYNIKHGESCGCLPKRINLHKKIQYNFIQNKNLQELYLNSNLMVQMSEAENLNSFTETISRLTYLIPNLQQLDICLCNNWHKDFPYSKSSKNDSCYTKEMMLIFSNGNNPVMNNDVFDIKNILPFLKAEHNPQFIVLLPVHYVSINLGYMAMYYENGIHYHIDTFLQYWRDSLANGLNTLSSKMNIEHMNKVIEEYSVKDQLTGMLNKKGFLKESADFIKKTQKNSKQCLMLVISWVQYTVPPINKNSIIDIIFSNSLKMLCSYDKLCARTGEKTFAVLMPLNNTDEENQSADKFTLSLEHMIQKLQGQPVLPEMPDINCDFTIVSATDEIEIFLDSLKNNVPKNHITDYSVQLKMIRKEIYISPQLEWTSENLADKIGISDGYFRRIYKSQFKISFKEDHINARINKAKTLLLNTNLTVSEIASECGFNNVSHFMRIFKSKSGKTALQFRKGQ